MGQGRGRERERNALRYSSGRSYPPRHGREFDRERRAARKKRRRRRLIKALAAWAATGLDTGLLRRCFGGFLLVVGLRELFRKG